MKLWTLLSLGSMQHRIQFLQLSDIFTFALQQDIVETIHKESQLTHPDTGESVHKDLGAFVLLITTHGSEGMIYGSDGKGIRLSDMYKLFSPKNFPAMKGKPKLIFIQACSGGMVNCYAFSLRHFLARA